MDFVPKVNVFIEKALGESFSGLKRKEGELRPAYSLLLLCSGLGSRREPAGVRPEELPTAQQLSAGATPASSGSTGAATERS